MKKSIILRTLLVTLSLIFVSCDTTDHTDEIVATFKKEESLKKQEECLKKQNHFWDEYNLECVNPCDTNPCGNITCRSTSTTSYECECSEGYWDGSKCGGEFPPCDTKNITPCIDIDTKYIWSTSVSDMNWDPAIAYCNNLSEGGYDDWNLPPINVLKTFYNGNGSSKLGDKGWFWSSTPGNDNHTACVMDFSDEEISCDTLKAYSTISVRCVR